MVLNFDNSKAIFFPIPDDAPDTTHTSFGRKYESMIFVDDEEEDIFYDDHKGFQNVFRKTLSRDLHPVHGVVTSGKCQSQVVPSAGRLQESISLQNLLIDCLTVFQYEKLDSNLPTNSEV